MRIAFFASTGHPNADNWMADLVDLFGMEVHAVDFEEADLMSPAIQKHVVWVPNLSRVQVSVRRSTPGQFLLCIPSLRRVLARVRPDVVLAYRITSYGFAAAAAGVRPLVLAGQGSGIVETSPPGSRWFARYAMRKADLIHAWGNHMASAMLRIGASPKKIQVLHRGVRTDIFRPTAAINQLPRIVTSRQLRRTYHTDLIIRALAQIRKDGTPAELWICGDGPHRTELENLVSNLGLGADVRFLGRLGIAELADVYQKSSVYASMVPRDGVSSSLLEAMASGLIPVVTDIEANRAWVDTGTSGFLVKPGDVQGLTKALAAALRTAFEGRVAGDNRARIVKLADRRTNLGLMVDLWRALVDHSRKSNRGQANGRTSGM